jgi:hypothetical protein
VPYLVVIGDVVASRAADSRGELQRSLTAAIERVNAAARRRLASPYTITLGDEFQAVYKSSRALLSDFWLLLEALHPVKIRLAIGIGEIVTPINERQALGMDGPSFYSARAAMDDLKKERESIIRVEAGAGALELSNAALRLVCRVIARWKRDTLSTLVRLAGGHAVEEIARQMKVTQRAIFKRLRTNSLREVLGVSAAVESELEKVMGEGG